jgi:hypothetical protein
LLSSSEFLIAISDGTFSLLMDWHQCLNLSLVVGTTEPGRQGGQMEKKQYKAPKLITYGPIELLTLAIPKSVDKPDGSVALSLAKPASTPAKKRART